MWSISNTVFLFGRASAHICCNDEWKSLHRADDDSLADDIKLGRCVVAQVYENQRYLLGQGWGAIHLLPTDRPAWSDATGCVLFLFNFVS